MAAPPPASLRAARWPALLAGWSVVPLIALCVWLGILAGRQAEAADEGNPRLLRITRAEFALAPANAPTATPPADGWQAVELPDNWYVRAPRQTGFAWYRMRIALDAPPSQPLALYLPRLRLVGQLYLNGSLLNPGVEFDLQGRESQPAQNETPIYIVLPSGLFRAGTNLLEVQLQGDARVHSGISAVTLGPADLLYPRWLVRYLVQVMASYVVMVLVAGTLCALLAYTRRERGFSLISTLLLAAVVTLAAFLAPGLPLSAGGQQALRLVVSMVMYWLLCVAGYRYARVRLPWFLPLLHAVSAATVVAALAIAAVEGASDGLWLLTWPHLVLRGAVAGLLLHRAWRERSAKLLALGAAAALWVAAIMHSNLLLQDLLPWDTFRWTIASSLPFCMVMLYVFAERFILDREESARAQQEVIAAERGRILQDMHDGMGAQLATALRLARTPRSDRAELARAIEEALLDLRLIIDSLDHTAQDDLLPLLGNLRFRLEPRLEALGIQLVWDMAPLPGLSGLPPQSALAVLRIVQEALHNALQHAGARRIEVSARIGGDHRVLIRVADDGRGFAEPARRLGGRGLAGMRLRAGRIGASLEVRSHAGGECGTVVELRLPGAARKTSAAA
ncbi:sensor histidine kinase [Xylophilus sp.]|uniref:sensor histidine kinase n=1 Tax=Xylophilus sp. TaxID=2653893 RepID=UPI0013BE2F26|nr:ATP-binding protein [Xylophilus sp.]KAF1047957.1 MAG: Nitrate/nitrite sensor protein NarQ [Xylophilus sp.]